MALATMQADPTWDTTAHAETVEAFERVAEDLTVHIWGGDWCGDCRRELPGLAAALEAAGIPESHIHQYVVDRDKEGELVDTYDVHSIPTVVLEIEGEEIGRFEEREARPAAEFLAEQLRATP